MQQKTHVQIIKPAEAGFYAVFIQLLKLNRCHLQMPLVNATSW